MGPGRFAGLKGILCAVALLAAPQGARAATAQPPMHNYEVRLVATVRAVDRRKHLVVVAYAPLETAPGGIRPVAVADRRALLRLEVGEAISGIADTRHSPWNLRDVHVLR